MIAGALDPQGKRSLRQCACGAMLGLRTVDAQLVSYRVSGMADLLLKRAPTIQQAVPLTVEQIKGPEVQCCNSDSLQDRVILGGVLVMMYGSARVSDLAETTKLVVDRAERPTVGQRSDEPDGFLELSVLCHQ